MWTSLDTLRNERRIVWLVPPVELPRYVRGRAALLPRRAGMSRRHQDAGPGVVVGYSELRPDAPASESPGGFLRRVFWLATHDPYTGGGAPCEAVDPRRVRVGQASAGYNGGDHEP